MAAEGWTAAWLQAPALLLSLSSFLITDPSLLIVFVLVSFTDPSANLCSV